MALIQLLVRARDRGKLIMGRLGFCSLALMKLLVRVLGLG